MHRRHGPRVGILELSSTDCNEPQTQHTRGVHLYQDCVFSSQPISICPASVWSVASNLAHTPAADAGQSYALAEAENEGNRRAADTVGRVFQGLGPRVQALAHLSRFRPGPRLTCKAELDGDLGVKEGGAAVKEAHDRVQREDCLEQRHRRGVFLAGAYTNAGARRSRSCPCARATQTAGKRTARSAAALLGTQA